MLHFKFSVTDTREKNEPPDPIPNPPNEDINERQISPSLGILCSPVIRPSPRFPQQTCKKHQRRCETTTLITIILLVRKAPDSCMQSQTTELRTFTHHYYHCFKS